MTVKAKHILILLMLFSFSSKLAWAGAPLCSQLFYNNQNLGSTNRFLGLSQLPEVVSLELPHKFLKILKTTIEKRTSLDRSQKLAFALTHYDPNGVRNNNLGFLGEQIQTHFVVKVLKIIFPNSIFIDLMDRKSLINAGNNGYKIHRFYAVDPAEYQRDLDPGQLSMPILKAANPGVSAIPHKLLRSTLGISEHAIIASLYIKSLPSLSEILPKIESSLKPQIIFLTRTGAKMSADEILALTNEFSSRFEFRLLSQFDPRLQFSKPVIVMNDLQGIVPYLYNVADIALVNGPVNFFEPILAGTKTIIVNNDEVKKEYQASVFDHMLEIAKQTNLAFEIKDYGQIPNAIKKANKSNQQSKMPFEVQLGSKSKSITNIFLDHLLEVVLADDSMTE